MSTLAELRARFADPPREFGMMPLWFWNDDLDETELLRQLREFHARGCGGVMPHARVGLSRRVGYLTPEFFRLVRSVTAEAERLGMKVVLYDEGSYPSGSAQGRVVAENPDWASRVLIAFRQRVAGPAAGYWRSNGTRYLCDRLVAGVAGRETGPDSLDPESLFLLESPDGELLRYDVPAGSWVLTAVWSVQSGASIRGVFPEEDDEHALAPPAADILNPDAVASFLRHTHEGYRQAVGGCFGSTVIAMFVDEPGLCGRGPRRGRGQARPYTEGFLDDLQAAWGEDVRRWLPALWLDCGPRTGPFRAAYEEALLARQRRVFYGPISEWCARHGLALTGHPPRSDESSAQRLFQWPGQDTVWWYVGPDNAASSVGRPRSAIEGEHSSAPKGAHSAALLEGRRFTTMEVFGAYGWHLTLDAVKWLLDWHIVRGINRLFPHAFFYSVRGRRAYESEPDLGVHNPWWPYWGELADYARRLCWLFTDAEEVCGAAILCDPDHLPWEAARALYRAQIPFLYAGPDTVRGAAVRDGRLRLGPAGVEVPLLVSDPPGMPADHRLAEVMRRFTAAGGRVLAEWTPETLPARLRPAPAGIPCWKGPPDLRLRLCRRAGVLFCLAVNEGEEAIAGELELPGRAVEVWDPLSGRAWRPAARPEGAGCRVALRLERRQGLVLSVCPAEGGTADLPEAAPEGEPGEPVLELGSGWEAFTPAGTPAGVPVPGDWARSPGFELYSGALVFRVEFALDPAQARQVRWVDLGAVGDIAEACLNGLPLGVRAWAPYRFAAGGRLAPGRNRLEVRVTNSAANMRYGRQMPSGLLGPVRLRR